MLSEIRMQTLEDKINAFDILGRFLGQYAGISVKKDPELERLNQEFSDLTRDIIIKTEQHNPWFTGEFIRLSFSSLALALKKENLEKWLSAYPRLHEQKEKNLDVGIVMAGNIPMVGFHDFLAVIMSGNNCRIKLSGKDDKLFPFIKKILVYLHPPFEKIIVFEEETLKNPDAVIATGSNNTSRYFHYYFGKYPHIIRKNRNSAAILTGSETDSDLKKLADDIFSYFGMGCRNVSKVFLPKGYEIPSLLKNFEHYSYFSNHNKYINNYDYHRAVHLVNSTPFYDTGFLIFKEDNSYSSPVGSVFYEFYDSPEELKLKLRADEDMLQCVVANPGFIPGSIEFGTTQFPMLWEYADNMDSLDFLINL